MNLPEPQNGSMDMNTLAKKIVDEAIGDTPAKKKASAPASKRGKARAEALTPERRSAIAREAAVKRWGK